MSPDSITITLDDKRKRLAAWWQKLQHVIGGAPLLHAGINRLQAPGGEGRALALTEIVFAVVLLALFARDLRAAAASRMAKAEPAEAHEHAGPDWFDVVAGVLLILEAVHSVHPGGKPLYQHALLYLGAVTMATGFTHGLVAGLARRRRFIRIDDHGVHARLSRFRHFEVAWPDVLDVRLGDRSAVILTTAGSHKISLWHYTNAREIRTALENWSARRALRAPLSL